MILDKSVKGIELLRIEVDVLKSCFVIQSMDGFRGQRNRSQGRISSPAITWEKKFGMYSVSDHRSPWEIEEKSERDTHRKPLILSCSSLWLTSANLRMDSMMITLMSSGHVFSLAPTLKGTSFAVLVIWMVWSFWVFGGEECEDKIERSSHSPGEINSEGRNRFSFSTFNQRKKKQEQELFSRHGWDFRDFCFKCRMLHRWAFDLSRLTLRSIFWSDSLSWIRYYSFWTRSWGRKISIFSQDPGLQFPSWATRRLPCLAI